MLGHSVIFIFYFSVYIFRYTEYYVDSHLHVHLRHRRHLLRTAHDAARELQTPLLANIAPGGEGNKVTDTNQCPQATPCDETGVETAAL